MLLPLRRHLHPSPPPPPPDKNLKPKQRLVDSLTHSGNVHPSLLTPSRHGRSRAAPALVPRTRFEPSTAGMKRPPAQNKPAKRAVPAVHNPHNLVVGVSSAVHLPAASPAAHRSGIKLATPDKIEARKNFEFKSEPMRNLPANASRFVSHPVLQGLPEHFSHPPLRPGLFTSVQEYLETTRKASDRARNQFMATPIQRLVLGHYFPPREKAGPTPPLAQRQATKPDAAKAPGKQWLPRGMLPGSKTLFAAETGSGKTLAYILPVIQGLKQSEEVRAASGTQQLPAEKKTPTTVASKGDDPAADDADAEADEEAAEPSTIRLRPRALILAPTHELARQIAYTFKAVAHHEKLRVACLSSGNASASGNGAYNLPPDCDVLVGTMNRVRDLMGLSVINDSRPDKAKQRVEDAALKQLIEREEDAARKWKDGPWRGPNSPTADAEDVWMPDKRLTWVENLRLREGLDAEEADGDEKPSWSRGLRSTGQATERRSRKLLSLENVEWLVLDEADVALGACAPSDLARVFHGTLADPAPCRLFLSSDRDFSEDLLPVIEPLMRRQDPPPPRTIFATATVPETLSRFLQQKHPETVRLITPNLHKLPYNLSVSRVAWSGGNWRADVLMEIRRAFVEDARDGNERSQVIVFVNKGGKAEELNEYLTEKGFGNLLMTSDARTRVRGSNKHVAGFLLNPRDQLQGLIEAKYDPAAHLPVKPPPKAIGNKVDVDAPDPEPAQTRVMVTTGVLSRGLDFSPNVTTVLMVDEPTNAVDFIHRAGRAGRAGNMGRVVIFSKSHKASMNALPHRHGAGGAGRGGAIWRTIQAARTRFEGRRAKKPKGAGRGGKKIRAPGEFKRR